MDTLQIYGDKNVATDEASGAPKHSHAEKNPAATTAKRANIVEKSLPSIGMSMSMNRTYRTNFNFGYNFQALRTMVFRKLLCRM